MSTETRSLEKRNEENMVNSPHILLCSTREKQRDGRKGEKLAERKEEDRIRSIISCAPIKNIYTKKIYVHI